MIKVNHLKTATKVGFIASIFFHSVVKCESLERKGKIFIPNFFIEYLHETFDNFKDIFLVDKGHFDIYLCKLELAIISKTFDDLEIPIKPGDHQDLFILLRRLGKGEEFSFMNPAGDKEIACALRGAFHKDRSFDLDEVISIEIFSCKEVHFMTHHKVVLHARAAQIEVAIF